AGQDRRLQMLDGIEQRPRVGHFRKRAVEIPGPREALPESAAAMPVDERLGLHAEQLDRAAIEVCEHAVRIQKEAGFGHQNRAGSSSTGIGASIGSHPWSRNTSLLSRALRPAPSDQVM